MEKIELFESASSDSGGCGRYGSKRFFLNKKDAEKDANQLFVYHGMVTTHTAYKDGGDILLGEDNGAYTRKERVIYLAMDKSKEDVFIKSILNNLTPEEQWILRNRL